MTYTYETLQDIIEANKEAAAGLWFSEESMKFFRTEIDQHIHPAKRGGAYFVTSELAPYDTERKWSVRYANTDGVVTTASPADFYVYATAEDAHDVAAMYAAE